jgi:hypothetical protein
VLTRTHLLSIRYFYRQLAPWLWGVFFFAWFGFEFVHGIRFWYFLGGWLGVKAIGYVGIWYLVRSVQRPSFSFYFNLGFREWSLFAWTYGLDLLLFFLTGLLLSAF